MTDSLLCYVDIDKNVFNDSLRMLENTGTKYVARAYAVWLPGNTDSKRTNVWGAKYDADFELLRSGIQEIHSIDPEIILEACVFETAWEGMNTIQIPEYVFEAFGLEYEERNFNYEDMLYTENESFETQEISILSDWGRDRWGEGIHIPDITKIETQMFFYYRMCEFIDLGFESFHIGQINLIGAKDEAQGFASFKKCLDMVREYAKNHARRGMVLINGHTPRHNFKDENNYLLSDFESFPLRLICDPDETDHEITEETPQKSVINYNYDGVYGKAAGGITPSGWECEHLPYIVEFDNYGGNTGTLNVAERLWGLDEISWFASQPDWYRREFLYDTYLEIKNRNENGFLVMPGLRTAYIVSEGQQKTYFANSSDNFSDGFGDEDTIKQIWQEMANN